MGRAVVPLQTTRHASHSSKHLSLRHPAKGLAILLVVRTSAVGSPLATLQSVVINRPQRECTRISKDGLVL